MIGCVKHSAQVAQLITNTNDCFLHITQRTTHGEPTDEQVIKYQVISYFIPGS